MTSLTRRCAARFALGSALLASACQHDSNADFDDTGLSPGAGATDAGGSDAAGAGDDAGGSSTGGSKPSAGNTSQGGKASAGASGSAAAGGKGGASSGGGKAGTDAGGTAPQGGKPGLGGMAGMPMAGGGMGGSIVVHPPEPMTFETIDIDDTQVASCFPNVNYGETKSMNVDGDGACRYEILIIPPLAGIPEGALVSAASLTLTCTNVGEPATVSYVNEPWKELMVRWNTRPEVGATLGSTTCSQLGKVVIDLTSAVKAWLSGDHQPYGIYLRTENTDGTDYDTSEADEASSRPKFSVTYTLPIK